MESDGHPTDHDVVDRCGRQFLSRRAWISSSDTALTAARLGHLGHEAGELKDLLHTLGRLEPKVVAAQAGALSLSLGRPIADSTGSDRHVDGSTHLVKGDCMREIGSPAKERRRELVAAGKLTPPGGERPATVDVTGDTDSGFGRDRSLRQD